MPIPQVTDRIKEAPAVALRAVFAGIGQLLMAVDKVRAQMQEQAASSTAPGQQRPGAAQPPRGQADGTSNVTVLRERATKPPAGTKPAAGAKPAAGPKSSAGLKSAAGPKLGTGAAKSAGAKPASGAAKPAAAAATVKPATEKPAARPAGSPAKPAAGTKPGAAAKPAAGVKPPASAKPLASAKPASASTAAPEPAAAKPAPSAAGVQAAPIPGYDDLSVASLRARLRGLDAAGVQALLDYERANARRGDVITMFERRLSKIENGAG